MSLWCVSAYSQALTSQAECEHRANYMDSSPKSQLITETVHAKFATRKQSRCQNTSPFESTGPVPLPSQTPSLTTPARVLLPPTTDVDKLI